MTDLTEEQWLEFYGLTFDEDGDEHGPPKGWKPDFTKWVAVLSCEYEDKWCIAPKPFWDANGFVPDHCIGFQVEGFRECQEHTLESDIDDQEQALRDLGFEVLTDAEWYFDRTEKATSKEPSDG